jgi:hypothetical protein
LNRAYLASAAADLKFTARELCPGARGAQGQPKLAVTGAGRLRAVWDESLESNPSPTARTTNDEHRGHAP